MLHNLHFMFKWYGYTHTYTHTHTHTHNAIMHLICSIVITFHVGVCELWVYYYSKYTNECVNSTLPVSISMTVAMEIIICSYKHNSLYPFDREQSTNMLIVSSGVEILSKLPDILAYFNHSFPAPHILCIWLSFNLPDIH